VEKRNARGGPKGIRVALTGFRGSLGLERVLGASEWERKGRTKMGGRGLLHYGGKKKG